MEVRRRRAGGGDYSPDEAQVVRTRPSEARSQWTVTQHEERPLSTALSTALTSIGESPFVTFIIDLVRQAVNLLWSPGASSSSGGPALDPRAAKLLAEFRNHTTSSYDPSNPKHEEKLLHLWACSFPQESLDERVSDQWKRLGFQGRDPATDFRGCGVFGLQQLIAYAAKYPDAFQFHLRGRHHEEAYPFAITAINLVNLIFQLLGWGMRPSTSPRAKAALIAMLFPIDGKEGARRFRQEEEEERERWRSGNVAGDDNDGAEGEVEGYARKQTLDTFSEVFVVTFHLFDREWRVANAHYMDFPKVIAATQTKLEAFLERNKSIDNVVHYNYTANLAISEST